MAINMSSSQSKLFLKSVKNKAVRFTDAVLKTVSDITQIGDRVQEENKQLIKASNNYIRKHK